MSPTDEERLAYPIPLPWAMRKAPRPAIERVVELAWVFMTGGLDPRLGLIAALESFLAERQPSWMRTFEGVFREATEELVLDREEYRERARVLREQYPKTCGEEPCDACVIGECRAWFQHDATCPIVTRVCGCGEKIPPERLKGLRTCSSGCRGKKRPEV